MTLFRDALRSARKNQSPKQRQSAPLPTRWPTAMRVCGRRLDSYWSHGRPAYRCQHGHSSAQPRGPSRQHNLYVREDNMITNIRELLRTDCLLELARKPEKQIVQYLHESGLVVTCTEAAGRLEPEFPN
jgi:site-specific DNA recombinase